MENVKRFFQKNKKAVLPAVLGVLLFSVMFFVLLGVCAGKVQERPADEEGTVLESLTSSTVPGGEGEENLLPPASEGAFTKPEDSAKENFARYDKDGRITLLEGDAAEVLKELDGHYDMIFMDAAKGQYIHFLPDVLRLLSPGGLLVSDNVLQDGNIIESRYAVTRRDRTIHSRMREYLYELKHNELLETVILPVGDGVTLSTKRKF